ncbi:RNA polymerase sigma factor [Candidatus Sumerlaeota bacterium]|nr:RNA polymerase sigma factor [Candidatus Sumerlaeota bacterium]
MTEVDSNLFRRATEGDRDAFWRLVTPHRGLIYSVARGMLGSHERAEDEMHDVLIAAFKALPTLRDASRLPSWLYSVTRNHVLDLIRREQRLRRAAEGAAHLAGETSVARVVTISERTEKERWLDAMEEGLERLPEPFRVILGMKYMNDYSCREIAEILDLSVAAVKSRLFEARKLLRRKMQALMAKGEERSHGMR